MKTGSLTIKELTKAVGGGVTPRMVRHYHKLGLLPQPARSPSNYRLYTEKDVIRLQRILALKQQGFQLNHIRQILAVEPKADPTAANANVQSQLIASLQQQYRTVMQQICQLRQTASALEGLLGRDRDCQLVQAEVLCQLKLLEAETKVGLKELNQLWKRLDAQVDAHPEDFHESLQHLLPNVCKRCEIEQQLLFKLVLACGDVSLASFVKLHSLAIANGRQALKSKCQIVADIPPVTAALDQARLVHLKCPVETLIDNPHIIAAPEAEIAFWQERKWRDKLRQLEKGCVLVVGYAPSVLLAICEAVENQQIQPALVIGMPIGFSHAPAAKRQLMQKNVAWMTIEGTVGGGLLAATALNVLAESVIDKPECHCYLQNADTIEVETNFPAHKEVPHT